MTEQSSEPALQRCEVCGGEEADQRLFEQCTECGAFFHLNPRNDREGKDCGDTWMTEDMTVGFLCQPCMDRMYAQATAGTDDAPPAAAPPAAAPPAAAPPATQSPAAQSSAAQPPPPRPERPATRRRYRRIDRG